MSFLHREKFRTQFCPGGLIAKQAEGRLSENDRNSNRPQSYRTLQNLPSSNVDGSVAEISGAEESRTRCLTCKP